MPVAQRPQEITIPLARVGNRAFLPDGVYTGTIKKVEVKTGAKGPYLDMQLAITGGSGLVFDKISFSEGHRPKMEEFLDSIGAPKTGPAWKPAQLVGKKFSASLGNESYQGKLKNIVLNYLTAEMAVQLKATQPVAVEDAFNGYNVAEDEGEDLDPDGEDDGDQFFEDDEFPDEQP